MEKNMLQTSFDNEEFNETSVNQEVILSLEILSSSHYDITNW